MLFNLILRTGEARLLFWLALCFFLFSQPANAENGERAVFKSFSLVLPPGWEGEEQTGFISGDPEEYLLVIGKKDEEGERFLAQASVYLLPNKPGASPESAAKKLAEAQSDASSPVKEGKLWAFTGEPRSNVVKGMAKTLVNASKDKLLIIIVQDPENMGGEAVLASLSGESPEARELLGR